MSLRLIDPKTVILEDVMWSSGDDSGSEAVFGVLCEAIPTWKNLVSVPIVS
jgi:hypothetical protein